MYTIYLFNYEAIGTIISSKNNPLDKIKNNCTYTKHVLYNLIKC